MKKVPMTISGIEHLKEELHQLKSLKRPQVIAAIAEARAHGDLKENAEYHAAKEMQGFIEGRIKEIETKLAIAQVIDVTKMNNQGKVIFGATIHLLNTQTNEVVKYQIVGEDEADLKHSKISVASPIARALIGKEEGDTVAVQTPAGLVNLEIDKVEYIEPVSKIV
jgi:transcription elongation factor GreA